MIKKTYVGLIYIVILIRSTMAEGDSASLYLLYQAAQVTDHFGLKSREGLSPGPVLSDEVTVYRNNLQNFQVVPDKLEIPQPSPPRFELVDETGISEPLPPPVFFHSQHPPLNKPFVRASLTSWQRYDDSRTHPLLSDSADEAAALLVSIDKNNHDQLSVILWSDQFISLHLLDEDSEAPETYNNRYDIPAIEDILTRHGRPLDNTGEAEFEENESPQTQSIRHWLAYLKASFGTESFAYKKNGLWYLVLRMGETVIIFSLYELEEIFFENLGRLSGSAVPMIMATGSPANPKKKSKVAGNRRGKSFKKTKPKQNHQQAIQQTIKDSGKKLLFATARKTMKTTRVFCRFCNYEPTGRKSQRRTKLLEHVFQKHHKKAAYCSVHRCNECITSQEELRSHARALKQEVSEHLCCPNPCCHFHSNARGKKIILENHQKICSVNSVLKEISPQFQVATAIYMSHRKLLNSRTRNSEAGLISYNCLVCNNHTKEPTSLVSHLGAVHQTPAITCPMSGCAFIFNNKQECREHIRIVKTLSQKLGLHCDSNEFCHFAAFNSKCRSDHDCKQTEHSFKNNQLHCQVNGCSFEADNKRDLLEHCRKMKNEDRPHYAAECNRQFCHAFYGYDHKLAYTENTKSLEQHTRTYHSREFHQRRKVSHYLSPHLWDMSGLKQALDLLEGNSSLESTTDYMGLALSWRLVAKTPEIPAPSVDETKPDPVAEYLGDNAMEQGSIGITLDYQDIVDPKEQEELADQEDPSGDTPIIVDTSEIHGQGVFAKRDIARYEFIARFSGKMTTARTHWDLNHCLFIQDKNGRWVLIKPAPDNPLKFLNHREQANAVFHNEHPAELYALEDIHEGEEIFVNYEGVLPEQLDWADMGESRGDTRGYDACDH